MSKLKVGINGFGRIGRVFFRAGFEKLDIVGINSLDSVEGIAHLLKYDSTHGQFNADVSHDEKNIIVNGKKIPVSQVKDPAQIPWKTWGADLVMECTGALKGKEDYQKHIAAGAKKVLISAPADGVDLTVVYGLNHTAYDPAKHMFLSNASCTTNCLAPLAKVLNDLYHNPSDNSTLQELAERINMTERTLARYSQKELGMSLHEWRQRLKVMKAMTMLNQGKTIESIAFDLGYASASAFIYMFKRWMGFTPDQFRKLYQ